MIKCTVFVYLFILIWMSPSCGVSTHTRRQHTSQWKWQCSCLSLGLATSKNSQQTRIFLTQNVQFIQQLQQKKGPKRKKHVQSQDVKINTEFKYKVCHGWLHVVSKHLTFEVLHLPFIILYIIYRTHVNIQDKVTRGVFAFSMDQPIRNILGSNFNFAPHIWSRSTLRTDV